MAKYKDLSMPIEELETSVNNANVHNADKVTHITSAERTAWNAKLDETATAVAAIADGNGNVIVDTYVTKAECTLHAAPMQDSTIEGNYMKFAEYTFPKSMNYESADLTLLVRNRGVLTAAKDGILRVRLRYGKSAATFQYAQIYWTLAAGIDPTKFILCYNNATATAELYLDTGTTYDGYIMKVLDMGTSSSIVDFTSWTLYSPTTGQTELPTEADGWTAVTSTEV